MRKRETFLQYAKQIKNLGYTVYISADEYYNYGYIVNKNNSICYFQLSDFFDLLNLSTVHIPCSQCGSGFRMHENIAEPTKEIVNSCFCDGPVWAGADLKYVTKYEGWEHYQSYKLNQICRTIKL